MRSATPPLPAVFSLAFLAAAGCAGGDSSRLVEGPCETVYGGQVCTWANVQGTEVTEFGATVSLSTVENAPLDAEMEFPPRVVAVIPLPEVVTASTGFNHLGVNWEAHGHPPALFLTPHFDFHFYRIDPDQVAAIDCADLNKPAALPAGYALPDMEIPGLGTLVGLCVPRMGMHAMPAAELNVADPFGASMLVGYYQREPIFVEPMISRAALLEKGSMSLTVPAVPQAEGSRPTWPTRFSLEYDAAGEVYRLVLSGITGTDRAP